MIKLSRILSLYKSSDVSSLIKEISGYTLEEKNLKYSDIQNYWKFIGNNSSNGSSINILKQGEKGLIEVVSVLPGSYPGHVLLTEDEGMILGEDDCPCGLKGKYFKIEGRIKNAEIRGCSDTYAAKF